jgi:WD40 repeat protein
MRKGYGRTDARSTNCLGLVVLLVGVTPGVRALQAEGPVSTDADLDQTSTKVANHEPAKLVGHRFPASCLAFSPDGKRLASSDAVSLRLWNVAKGESLSLLDPNPAAPDGRVPEMWIVTSVAFTPDGKSLLAFCGSFTFPKPMHRKIARWDVATGRRGGDLLLPTEVTAPMCQHMAIAPVGGIVAFAYPGATRAAVRLINFTAGRPMAPLPITSGGLCRFDFSPNGKLLAVGDTAHNRVEIWDVRRRRLTKKIPGYYADRCVFSKDGKQVLVADSQSGVHRIDIATGKLVETVVELDLGEVDFDSPLFASGGDDHSTWAWHKDEASGTFVSASAGGPPIKLERTGHVAALSFSPDGKVLAVATGDRREGIAFDAAAAARGKDCPIELRTLLPSRQDEPADDL